MQALPLLTLLSQSVRAEVLEVVVVLMHLRQLRQHVTLTAQLLMLLLLLLLLLLVGFLLRRPALLLQLLLLLLLLLLVVVLLRSLIQLLLQLRLLLVVQLLLQLRLLPVVQLLVLRAPTPSIQLLGRTAGCLLQLMTKTVSRAKLRGAIRHLGDARLFFRSSPKQINGIARMLLICASCCETRDAEKVLPTNLCAGPSAAQV